MEEDRFWKGPAMDDEDDEPETEPKGDDWCLSLFADPKP